MCVCWMSAPLSACDLQSVDVSADMIAFWKLRLKRAASGVNGGRQPAGGEVTAALQTGGSEYGLSGEKLNLLGWSRWSFSQLTVICMLWISHTHIHPPLAWWWSWIRFSLATKNRSGERTHDSLCVSTNQHFFFPPGRFCNFGVTPSPVTPIFIVGTRLHSHQLQLNHTSIFDDGVSEAAIRNLNYKKQNTSCIQNTVQTWRCFQIKYLSALFLDVPLLCCVTLRCTADHKAPSFNF